jgi:hypothetical protein
MILPNNLQFILWDKVNNKEADISFYLDDEGNLWIDANRHQANMNGSRTIRYIGPDHAQYELKVINKQL